jgi:hypothetical protein
MFDDFDDNKVVVSSPALLSYPIQHTHTQSKDDWMFRLESNLLSWVFLLLLLWLWRGGEKKKTDVKGKSVRCPCVCWWVMTAGNFCFFTSSWLGLKDITTFFLSGKVRLGQRAKMHTHTHTHTHTPWWRSSSLRGARRCQVLCTECQREGLKFLKKELRTWARGRLWGDRQSYENTHTQLC